MRTINKLVFKNTCSVIKNEKTSNSQTLTLRGVIADDDFFDDVISLNSIKKQIDESKDVRILLSSPGGDAFEGIEIYNYLKSLKSKVTIEVTSLAASAASIVAMAGDEVVMRTGSTLMIHEASTMAIGTKSDIQKTLNALEAIDESILSIYLERTNLSSETLKEMVTAETWLTADQAIEHGFANTKTTKKATKGGEEVKHTALADRIGKLVAQAIEEEENGTNDEDTLEARVKALEEQNKEFDERLKALESDAKKDDEENPTQNYFKNLLF